MRVHARPVRYPLSPTFARATRGSVPVTQDGQDNTVLESRWSCEKPDMSELECFITFEFEQDVAVDHVTICE